MSPAAASGSLTFIGTATTLIRYGALTLLTDPNFLHRGQRAYLGHGLSSRRRTDPALRVDELPPLDAVVLSHLHGDHFDRVAKRGLDRQVPIVTTAQAARRLGAQGFAAVEPLATWASTVIRSGSSAVRITAMPGRHGPGPVQALLPPVMGSLLEFSVAGGEPDLTVYISGDTLMYDGLREITRRHPQIDVAVAHLGGTRVLGVLVTMDDRHGGDFVDLVAPATVVPIHYDDYGVFRSPLADFRREVERRGSSDRVTYVERGQTVELPRRRGPAQ